jgi:hypothetical protein
LDARPFGFQAGCFQQPKDLGIEPCVTIQNDVPQRADFGKGLPQLLDDPLRRWMLGHVEVQDFPASVFDDEEAVKQFERQRRNGKEVVLV